jgi:hypothetical protein
MTRPLAAGCNITGYISLGRLGLGRRAAPRRPKSGQDEPAPTASGLPIRAVPDERHPTLYVPAVECCRPIHPCRDPTLTYVFLVEVPHEGCYSLGKPVGINNRACGRAVNFLLLWAKSSRRGLHPQRCPAISSLFQQRCRLVPIATGPSSDPILFRSLVTKQERAGNSQADMRY